jgi:hypothetical protein
MLRQMAGVINPFTGTEALVGIAASYFANEVY